jgi:hypothetical protein
MAEGKEEQRKQGRQQRKQQRREQSIQQPRAERMSARSKGGVVAVGS